MEKNVTVLTPNGRRQNVKVTPNTTLLQILEEACLKHGLDSEDFCLKHHNKEVGLTQIFRFSGLPNNCLLEMSETNRRRVISNVDICIQLESGVRSQGQFNPSDNLWQVVEKVSADEAADYKSPVAIYMRQEIIGKQKMLSTTLKSLGIIEGRAMIRFINKTPEELKRQANVYIAPVAKVSPNSDDDLPRSSRYNRNPLVPSAGGFAITKDLVQSLKKTDATNDDQAKEATENDEKTDVATSNVTERPKFDWNAAVGRSIISDLDMSSSGTLIGRAEREREEEEMEHEVKIIGDRNAILYSLDATQTHLEDLPDSFYDLTVHDLKLVLRDLKKVAAGSEDAPMLTEKLRELEDNKTMLNKMAQYKNCVIRVKFPDRHVLQGIFKPIDKVSDVVEFVRKFLLNPELKFHLFTIPPKTILPCDKTLLELNLVPNAVLNFALDEDDANSVEPTFLREEFLSKLTSAEGAIYTAKKFRITNPKTTTDESSSSHNLSTEYKPRPPDASTGAIPKRPRNSMK